MSKIYAQKALDIHNSDASMAGNASVSGSAYCDGYSKLRGLFITNSSTLATSGLAIQFSHDGGDNYDYTTASDAVSANTIVACGLDVYGDRVKITICNGADDASLVRSMFYLLPI